MSKNNAEQTKKPSRQSTENGNVSEVSNSDVTRMYNMPNMASGPSDATSEERKAVEAQSAAAKGNSKK